jgi:hypothetical protein
MKILYLLCLLFVACSISFAGGDSVFVMVQGDTVQIWDTRVDANCCSVFDFSIAVSNDTVIWVQRDTAHQVCYCNCMFEFNATITGLDAGNYTVEVYRSSIVPTDTTIFVGSASFTKGATTALYRKIHQYQSNCGSPTGIWDQEGAPSFKLAANYPNPFNPSTTIRFYIARESFVTLAIYNVLGEEVKILADNARFETGSYEKHFDGSHLASGVYYYRLVAQPIDREGSNAEQNYVSVKKMLLVK